MYLMMKDEPVLQIDVDKNIYKVLHPDLVPYPLRGTLKEFSELPAEELGQLITKNPQEYEKYAKTRDYIRDKNREFFTNYLAHRTLSLSGKNHKKLLNTLDLGQGRTDVERAKIAVYCKATSMSDNYWLKEEKSNLSWKDVDLKTNSLSDVVAQITLHGTSLTIQGTPRTPELGNNGTYAQAWKRENGTNYLYKKSTVGGHESETEVRTSQILDCFNIPHVSYHSAKDANSDKMCKCENLATEELNMVSSTDVGLYCERNGIEPLQYMLKIDAENIYKMCVADYLVSNTDRHSGNWGFYMSSETGSLLCCHPLFDHNNAFDEGDMDHPEGGISKVFKGKTKKEAAEYSIKKCNLVCIKPVTRDMFYGEKEYNTFMSRACELGLYEKNKNSFFRRIRTGEEYSYAPKQIYSNAAVDYKKTAQYLYAKDLEEYRERKDDSESYQISDEERKKAAQKAKEYGLIPNTVTNKHTSYNKNGLGEIGVVS